MSEEAIMGDGTEPRGDDILELSGELYAARQKIMRLEAELGALREAWAQVANVDRHDFGAGVEKLLDDFMRKLSARSAFDAHREAGRKFFSSTPPAKAIR